MAAGRGDEKLREAAVMTMQHVDYAAAMASERQASGGSPPSASPRDSAATTQGEAPSPTTQLAAAPARMCAAPGCGATRGLKRCGGCGTVRYCSEACSRVHWWAHKAECRRLQAERAAGAAGEASVAEVPNA